MQNETPAAATATAPRAFRGFRRFAPAMNATLAGLRHAMKHEEAVFLEVIGLVVLFPVAMLLGSTGVERALLAGSLLLVLIVELLNTAVEAAIDRIGPERHTLSGLAKDLGSAAVFVALSNAVIIWLLLLVF